MPCDDGFDRIPGLFGVFWPRLHRPHHQVGASEGENQRIDAKFAKVLVEILELRRQGDCLDPNLGCPIDQACHSAITCWIIVADNVEAAQRRREQNGRQMRGRKCGDHRHSGYDASERQRGLDAFASRHDIMRDAEADSLPEEMTHRASR